MNVYRWRTVVGPILFGLQGVLVLRTLRVDHTQFLGEEISVPLFRGAPPVYVAVDSALPPGYDMVYNYDKNSLTIYSWNGVDENWRRADSLNETLEVRVLFIYETLRAS